VTGYGRAQKDQVQKMVQAVLGMSVLPRPDDAADALAVAICLAHGRPIAAAS
jgi:crossover junction endodeoxyribonuclease RuvC